MKRIFMALSLLLAAGSLRAADLTWQTSLPQATAQAKTDHKLVLIDFTGSDWCPWCIKLKKEVFSQPEFTAYAQKNLILVEVDFPRRTSQPETLKKTNQALLEKYGIKGLPTVIVLNSQGDKVGELGYQEGGPKAFIAKLEPLKP
jgi:thioredoxin-related protein